VAENDREIHAIFMDCDNCGHCIDLHAETENDDPKVKEARKKITDIIRKWIS
jgi:hypothetical protein